MKIFFISKKLLYIILATIIGLMVLSIFIIYKENNKTKVSFLPITNKVIGIDPGHGGIDPGAVSKDGIKEDEINLKIVLKLKRFIEQSGGIAVLTRDSDKGLYTEKSTTLRQMKNEDLKKRKEIIEEAECDIFLTIHLNSFIRSSYYGAQTFYLKGDENSLKLAQIIQDELRYFLDENNRRQPNHRDDVFLLKEMNIPTVLIEAGFLSNENEAKLLNTEEYQEKIAWSIYVGIMKYFNGFLEGNNL